MGAGIGPGIGSGIGPERARRSLPKFRVGSFGRVVLSRAILRSRLVRQPCAVDVEAQPRTSMPEHRPLCRAAAPRSRVPVHRNVGGARLRPYAEASSRL